MEYYIIFINNAFTSLNGDQFKLSYIIALTMAGEDSCAVELPIGYLMQLMNKSERSVRKTLNELIEMGVLLAEDGLYRFNIEAFEEVDEDISDEDPKPKRVGFV